MSYLILLYLFNLKTNYYTVTIIIILKYIYTMITGLNSASRCPIVNVGEM